MDLDVVIPSFRDERVLETIDSVVQSDLSGINLRIIVQVGRSGEEYENLIRDAYPFVEVGCEPDNGIFDAINIGLKKCKGDLVLTLGSDDRISNSACFQLVADKLKEGHVCILTDMEYTDHNWNPKRYWKAVDVSVWNYFLGYQHAHFSLFLDPRIYSEIGFFNVTNRVNADYEFFWFLTKYLRVKKLRSLSLPVPCVQMKLGGNSSRSLRKVLLHQFLMIRFVLFTAPFLLPSVIFFKWFHKLVQFSRVF